MKVVFFGTPEFSVPCLKLLHEHESIDVACVVSMPDRKAGRGKKLQTPPVAQYAKDHDLKLIQTPNINKDEEALQTLNSIQVDFFLVIAFAQFLGKKVLNLPKLGAFNIHTSLLPKYRGAAPIQYALLNGDQETGVTIQKMVSKMDAGDIAYFHKVPIDSKETSGSLFKKLEKEAALGLDEFLKDFIKAPSEISLTPQDEKMVSFAPTIDKQDGLIDPFHHSAEEIFNQSRAYSPWPGQFLFINDQRLKVTEVEVFPKEVEVGKISTEYGVLLLGTKQGSIRLSKVQPEGKKPQADSDFLNGLKSKGLLPTLNKEHYE